MRHDKSHDLFERAQALLPGGVNSPVRAFRKVGGEPFFIQRGEGARLYDVDGNEYVDYVMSWGPLMLGHAHPAVIEAVRDAATRGTSYGAPTGIEVELAALIHELVPSMEMMRLVSSGTEACLSAVRLARGATGRDFILKFSGCYHGHADSFLVQAGSGVATLGLPDSPGVPAELAKLTLTVPFNDVDGVKEAFRKHPDQIACVIVEPIVGNGGFIEPAPGFLEALRSITQESGALLIFDEVMTGFRVALGGAQQRYNIKPDLSTFGKVIGAGLPVGAYGGRKDLMQKIAPLGPIYQAGTLSGNPLAMAAGLAQLKILQQDNPYDAIETRGRRLLDAMLNTAKKIRVKMSGNVVGAMWGFHFTDGPVRSFEQAKTADADYFNR
ncbi:MAG TPA: glutamate-1-semialdehyde 2,1-aminomutase, partial [Longimicrobiales bacterium]|nr:glutamate-1-semialdehyde 2,1-aminomutase [Longimicrobiales bacterium]